uniref:Uncharacterized protein n=1 Tax=Cercocebus atys TaxID=9531 RepID=A0A2K5MNF2_CERAT
ESLEDCPVDEVEDAFQGLGKEDEEIDQFSDNTFGSGAIDDHWQEAHECLAELEEKQPVAVIEQKGNGERHEMDLWGDHKENLVERLSKMVTENELEDPAIMRTVQTSLNSRIWDESEVLRGIQRLLLTQEVPTVSVLEYDQDLSEHALPRRSTSSIIGSPPVRAVPIGAPPKQMTVPSLAQHFLCPKPVHVQPPMPPHYPAPYGDRTSPSQLCCVPLQPGCMSPSQFAWVPGFVGSLFAAMNPNGQMLPPAPGFCAFFSQHPPGPGLHLQSLRSQAPMFILDTTHFHPQQQQNRNQHRNLNGAGDRGSQWNTHQDNL